jgi:uncharacterized protein YjbI with pentapeptide repeats
MREARLVDCVFPTAEFSGADLRNARIYSCRLEGAYFAKALLRKAKFHLTDITDVVFYDVVIGDPPDISHAIIRPYVASQRTERARVTVPSPTTPPKQTIAAAGTSIYTSKNLAARLYCADVREFKGVRSDV